MLFLFFVSPLSESQENVEEYRLKAELMERFTRFIEWPDEKKSLSGPTFVIGIMGKNPFGTHIESTYKNLKIKGKTPQILEVQDMNSIGSCNVLFIAPTEKERLPEILSRTANKPILTVSDTEGFGNRGVLINFYAESKYVHFEINPAAVQKSRLKFSSRLLNLARLVETER